MRHPTTDLLGAPLTVPPRRKLGYAARPGTGPKGQRCNTCVHCIAVAQSARRSRKCELKAAIWTTTPETDIKHNAPACLHWQRKEWAARAA